MALPCLLRRIQSTLYFGVYYFGTIRFPGAHLLALWAPIPTEMSTEHSTTDKHEYSIICRERRALAFFLGTILAAEQGRGMPSHLPPCHDPRGTLGPLRRAKQQCTGPWVLDCHNHFPRVPGV